MWSLATMRPERSRWISPRNMPPTKYRKKINISSVLAGQRLGIKEVDEGIWLVSFMHSDLGYFDLEHNPFGTRLLPMS